MDSSAAIPEEVVSPAPSLLSGEDPTSIHPEDPQHWVTVYSELFESTKRMLAAVQARLDSPAANDQADVELAEREISALVARSEFFAARLRWWGLRGRELWAETRER